jgi:hypothetical protein
MTNVKLVDGQVIRERQAINGIDQAMHDALQLRLAADYMCDHALGSDGYGDSPYKDVPAALRTIAFDKDCIARGELEVLRKFFFSTPETV